MEQQSVTSEQSANAAHDSSQSVFRLTAMDTTPYNADAIGSRAVSRLSLHSSILHDAMYRSFFWPALAMCPSALVRSIGSLLRWHYCFCRFVFWVVFFACVFLFSLHVCFCFLCMCVWGSFRSESFSAGGWWAPLDDVGESESEATNSPPSEQANAALHRRLVYWAEAFCTLGL